MVTSWAEPPALRRPIAQMSRLVHRHSRNGRSSYPPVIHRAGMARPFAAARVGPLAALVLMTGWSGGATATRGGPSGTTRNARCPLIDRSVQRTVVESAPASTSSTRSVAVRRESAPSSVSKYCGAVSGSAGSGGRARSDGWVAVGAKPSGLTGTWLNGGRVAATTSTKRTDAGSAGYATCSSRVSPRCSVA